MEKRIDEVWADYYSQGIREKIQDLEFYAKPFVYNVYVKTFFSDPRKKAVKKVRKYAEKWNYGFIYYRHCESIPGFPNNLRNSFFKQCNLQAVLYRRLLKRKKVLEELEEEKGKT